MPSTRTKATTKPKAKTTREGRGSSETRKTEKKAAPRERPKDNLRSPAKLTAAVDAPTSVPQDAAPLAVLGAVDAPPIPELTTAAPATTAASADATTSAPTTPPSEPSSAEPASERRLPPVGTVLTKRGRDGAVRCECVVTAEGVRFRDTVYRSLSGAARAAAQELGLAARSIDGWAWWGLKQPARSGRAGRDPLSLLERAWASFRERVNQLLGEDVPEEARSRVLAQVKEHAKALDRLGGSAA